MADLLGDKTETVYEVAVVLTYFSMLVGSFLTWLTDFQTAAPLIGFGVITMTVVFALTVYAKLKPKIHLWKDNTGDD